MGVSEKLASYPQGAIPLPSVLSAHRAVHVCADVTCTRPASRNDQRRTGVTLPEGGSDSGTRPAPAEREPK
jgi:hypothetical protein